MLRVALTAAIVAGSLAPAAASPRDPDERTCPADVRGVRVASSPLRDGVAFVFTVVERRQLAGLRTLLRDTASIVQQQSKYASQHPDVMPTSDGAGAMPALAISIRNTPTGAIVSVRPEQILYVSMLQHNARGFELYWSSHACVSVSAMARLDVRTAATRR